MISRLGVRNERTELGDENRATVNCVNRPVETLICRFKNVTVNRATLDHDETDDIPQIY